MDPRAPREDVSAKRMKQREDEARVIAKQQFMHDFNSIKSWIDSDKLWMKKVNFQKQIPAGIAEMRNTLAGYALRINDNQFDYADGEIEAELFTDLLNLASTQLDDKFHSTPLTKFYRLFESSDFSIHTLAEKMDDIFAISLPLNLDISSDKGWVMVQEENDTQFLDNIKFEPVADTETINASLTKVVASIDHNKEWQTGHSIFKSTSKGVKDLRAASLRHMHNESSEVSVLEELKRIAHANMRKNMTDEKMNFSDKFFKRILSANSIEELGNWIDEFDPSVAERTRVAHAARDAEPSSAAAAAAAPPKQSSPRK